MGAIGPGPAGWHVGRCRFWTHRPRHSVLFPVLKRQSETLSLGYVTARIVESAFIAIGLVSLLAVVTLRQDVSGVGGAASLVGVGRALVAIHDWTFLLGPGWVVGVGNGLL